MLSDLANRILPEKESFLMTPEGSIFLAVHGGHLVRRCQREEYVGTIGPCGGRSPGLGEQTVPVKGTDGGCL